MILAREPLAVLDLHHLPGPWMERIEDPLLERRTPGIVTLVRPAPARVHLSAALGLALVENGWRVMFARTTDLVQRLQVARRELALESTIAKLDRYDLIILDDIA